MEIQARDSSLIPKRRTDADYSRRYRQSQKGTAREIRRNTVKRNRTIERYLNKEFVAWDGEGGNEPDGSGHTYFLLANSDDKAMSTRHGLPTVGVFEMMLASRSGVTNIIYGGNYDVNCWIKDLSMEALSTLYQTGKTRWNGYYLEWRPGKSFSVKQGDNSFLIFDVLPFFQTSFVKACDEYLGNNWLSRDEIIREKARRGEFDWSEIESVASYNRAELSNLVSLANELRERLFKVDIRVTRWDGPGAIAASLYKKYEIKSHIGSPPAEVISAGRYAYAGGRFEIIRKGHSISGAYQYDIRSAYPSAIRSLPCCNPEHGVWRYRTFTDGPIRDIKPFGMYRIEVVNPWPDNATRPQPLWQRNKNGTVYFGEYCHNWYWSPEAQLMTELKGVNIYEAWEWEQNCACNPFHFVEPLYNKRAALKKANDGAHVGLKLGLNSLYGKLAQQIGFDEGPPLRLPPYHSLEWAGYITSHCRAQIYRAAMHSIDDVIAFETDAIFSRVPLPLDIGTGLGQWDETKYSSLTYLKSGFYFGTLSDGKEVRKSRGFNPGAITRDEVIEALESDWMVLLRASQTRFIGLGLAMNQGMHKWRHWITAPREISILLNSKRLDVWDNDDVTKELNDGWHETIANDPDAVFSYRYPVLWESDSDSLTASPEGLSIDEFRTTQAHEVDEP